MAIIQDVKPTGTDSAYVERPFDEAKAGLESNGYKIISLEQFARLRIAQGKDSHVSNYGSYAREGFLYVPQKGIFLVRNSPILANAKEATAYHRKNQEFYLNDEQVEAALVNSVQFKDSNLIPTNRFGEDERTVFAFGEIAGKYGEFLNEAGIKEMLVYLANLESKPFARQAWLHGLVQDFRSVLNGYDRNLGCSDAVRGVRNVEPLSGETVSTICVPSLADVVRYSKSFVPEVARKDFEKGLETLFREQ
ncbi:MAG: hypothetical protein WC494_00750 [Candidatus Pacearchaeota archaeon]